MTFESLKERLRAAHFSADARPEPTHTTFQGFPVTIEQPIGSTRTGVDADGTPWETKFKVPYGFIDRVKGLDAEGLDIFLGPDKGAKEVHLVNQQHLNGDLDEQKVLANFPSAAAAKATYLEHHGNRPEFFRSMTTMPVETFRRLCHRGIPGSIRWKRKNRRPMRIEAIFSADQFETETAETEWRQIGTHSGHGGHPALINKKTGVIASGELKGKKVSDLSKSSKSAGMTTGTLNSLRATAGKRPYAPTRPANAADKTADVAKKEADADPLNIANKHIAGMKDYKGPALDPSSIADVFPGVETGESPPKMTLDSLKAKLAGKSAPPAMQTQPAASSPPPASPPAVATAAPSPEKKPRQPFDLQTELRSALGFGKLTIPVHQGKVDDHLAQAYKWVAERQGLELGDFVVNPKTGRATATVDRKSKGNAANSLQPESSKPMVENAPGGPIPQPSSGGAGTAPGQDTAQSPPPVTQPVAAGHMEQARESMRAGQVASNNPLPFNDPVDHAKSDIAKNSAGVPEPQPIQEAAPQPQQRYPHVAPEHQEHPMLDLAKGKPIEPPPQESQEPGQPGQDPNAPTQMIPPPPPVAGEQIPLPPGMLPGQTPPGSPAAPGQPPTDLHHKMIDMMHDMVRHHAGQSSDAALPPVAPETPSQAVATGQGGEGLSVAPQTSAQAQTEQSIQPSPDATQTPQTSNAAPPAKPPASPPVAQGQPDQPGKPKSPALQMRDKVAARREAEGRSSAAPAKPVKPAQAQPATSPNPVRQAAEAAVSSTAPKWKQQREAIEKRKAQDGTTTQSIPAGAPPEEKPAPVGSMPAGGVRGDAPPADDSTATPGDSANRPELSAGTTEAAPAPSPQPPPQSSPESVEQPEELPVGEQPDHGEAPVMPLPEQEESPIRNAYERANSVPPATSSQVAGTKDHPGTAAPYPEIPGAHEMDPDSFHHELQQATGERISPADAEQEHSRVVGDAIDKGEVVPDHIRAHHGLPPSAKKAKVKKESPAPTQQSPAEQAYARAKEAHGKGDAEGFGKHLTEAEKHASEAEAKESAEPPAKTPKKKRTPPRIHEIRNDIAEAYKAQGGGVPLDVHTFAESLPNAFTFKKNGPMAGDAKQYVGKEGGKEGVGIARSGAIKFTDDPSKSGAEDAIGQFKEKYGPKGEDLYWQLARERSGYGWQDALKHARSSNDPDLAFKAAVHDTSPNQDGGKKSVEQVKPDELQMDEAGTINQIPVHVTENAEGEPVLKDGTDFPETPLKDLRSPIPFDKGSRRVEELEDKPTAPEPWDEPAAPAPVAKQESPAEPATKMDKMKAQMGAKASPKDYVRAPAGGAVSPVDGKRYAGGWLMPIHGKYSGQEKPEPKGIGAASELAKEGEEGEGRRRGGGNPSGLSVEDRQRNAEHQKKWDEMRNGPLGKVKWMGNTPNAKAMEGGTNLKNWREYAEKLGPEGVKKIIDTLEPQYHNAIDEGFAKSRAKEAQRKAEGKWSEHDGTGIPPDMEDWHKQNSKKTAEESVGHLPGGKKHEKLVPGSHYARQLVHEMMDKQNHSEDKIPIDRLHGLHSVLTDAEKAKAAATPAETPPADETKIKRAIKNPDGSQAGMVKHVVTPKGPRWLLSMYGRDGVGGPNAPVAHDKANPRKTGLREGNGYREGLPVQPGNLNEWGEPNGGDMPGYVPDVAKGLAPGGPERRETPAKPSEFDALKAQLKKSSSATPLHEVWANKQKEGEGNHQTIESMAKKNFAPIDRALSDGKFKPLKELSKGNNEHRTWLNQHISKLADEGHLQRAWDKEGNTHYGKVGASIPSHLTQESVPSASPATTSPAPVAGATEAGETPSDINPRYAAYLKTTDQPTNHGFMSFISKQKEAFRKAHPEKMSRDGDSINDHDNFTKFIENQAVQPQSELSAPEPKTPIEAMKSKMQKPKESPHLNSHQDFLDKLHSGDMTAKELQDHFAHTNQNADAIKAELNGLKRDQLERLSNSFYAKTMNKKELADSAHRAMLQQHYLGESISHGMGKGEYEKALAKAIGAHTDEDVKKYTTGHQAAVAERAAKIAAARAGMDNPETLEDFNRIHRIKGEIPVEHQEKHDRLVADKAIADRAAEQAKRAVVSQVSGTPEGLDIDLKETKHTKTGEPLHVAVLNQRVDSEKYKELNQKAKMLGGWYSSFRGAGAIPGFQFKSKEAAEKFRSLLSGNADRSEELAQRQGEKVESNSERLKQTAEALKSRAEEQLNADRKTNTARRAGMAASMESRARGDIAKANSLATIAEKLGSGEAKYLSGVKAATHLDTLDSVLNRAKWDRINKTMKDAPYDQRESAQSAPPSHEDVTHVDYPYPKLWASDLRKNAKAFANEPGLKNVAKKLIKAAEANGPQFKSAVGGVKASGGRVLSPEGLPIRVPEGKGVRVHQSHDYRLVSNAQKQGIGHKGPFYTADAGKSWATSPENSVHAALVKNNSLDLVDQPKDDLMTISDPADVDALTLASNRLRNHPNRDLQRIGASLHDRAEQHKRLQAMGINSPHELRTALREYLPIRSQKENEDPIKKKERALIGQKIPGFFPTPRPLIDRMLDTADIKPSMKVLEPSAGKGDILDAIKERHPDADTHAVEQNHALRDLLTAKGHNLVGDDAMTHEGEYDRIVMNPPFENGQDQQHVKKAFGSLKPGGRLVAVVGAGVGGDRAKPFRDWLEANGGSIEDLPQGSFAGNDAFRQTGVNTKLITLEKPEKAEQFSADSDPDPFAPSPLDVLRAKMRRRQLQPV